MVTNLREAAAPAMVVLLAAVLASCGVARTNAHGTATVASTSAPTRIAKIGGGAPRPPAPTAHSQGPGRLLAPVILYRLQQDDPESPSYWAYFRTSGAFAPKGGDGTLTPGQIWIGDSWDDHDGLTPLGAGTPRGRCYSWGVTRTEALDRAAIGTPFTITLRLKRTTGVQERTARLRDASDGILTPRFTRQLARIGCRLRPQRAG